MNSNRPHIFLNQYLQCKDTKFLHVSVDAWLYLHHVIRSDILLTCRLLYVIARNSDSLFFKALLSSA